MINPTTGKCITCKEKGVYPNEGECCPKGQKYDLAAKSCVDLATLQNAYSNAQGSACITRHPSLKICLKCAPGY